MSDHKKIDDRVVRKAFRVWFTGLTQQQRNSTTHALNLAAALRTVREELRAVEDACGDVGVNLVSLPNAVRNLKSELQAVREERDDLKKQAQRVRSHAHE